MLENITIVRTRQKSNQIIQDLVGNFEIFESLLMGMYLYSFPLLKILWYMASSMLFWS